MNQIPMLIWFTLRELSSQRIYRLLLLSLVLIPWLLLIPASLFLLDVGKVFTDLLFTTLHAWLLAYLFFLAAPLLARDIEQGICSLFLTIPMSRESYLWGRFLGLIGSIFPLLFCYIISAVFAFLWAEGVWPIDYVAATSKFNFSMGAVLIMLPYLALAAVLFLIAAGATGLAEISVFLFSVWLLCWAIPPVLDALQQVEVAAKTPSWIGVLLHGIDKLLPQLSSSHISLQLAHQLPLTAVSIFGYILHHLTFTTLAMMAATTLFKRRDLR